MKKFGTPSGAGPGSAKENVGLAGVGTPGPVGPAVAGLTGAGLRWDDLWCPEGLVGCLVDPGCEERVFDLEVEGCDEPVLGWPPCREGCEDVVVEVVVEVVEVVVEEEVVEVVTVTDGVVAVEDWQLAVTLLTGGVPGGSIWDGGVPGAALTVKLTVWPLSSVAVTVHSSAEAIGIAATPMVTRTAPTAMIAIFSLWLIDTLVSIPPATDLDRADEAGAASQAR